MAAKKKEDYNAVKAKFEKLKREGKGQEVKELLDEKKYVIGGFEFTQDYLNISETIKVTKLLSDVDFSNAKGVFDVLEKLETAGKLEAFFNIILQGESPLVYERLRPATAIEILTDFFYLNEVSQIIANVISAVPKLTTQLTAVAGTK